MNICVNVDKLMTKISLINDVKKIKHVVQIYIFHTNFLNTNYNFD